MNRVLKSNLFAGSLIVLGIFGGVFLSILFSFLNLPLPLMLVLSQILLLLLPAFIYFVVTKESVKETLRLRWPGWLTILFSILIAILIQPLMMFLSALSGLFFTNDVAELIEQMNSFPMILMIAVVALTPAICEEITMRGILLSGYNQIDIKKAMLLNGLFFGMLHLNLQQFLYAFALGVLFAYMVRVTDSIIPSMVAHFTINGSQVLMQKLFIFMAQSLNQDIAALTQEPTFMDKLISLGVVFILALIITPIAGVLIYALRNLYCSKNIEQKDVIESLDTSSHQRVFNWPVWVSIGLYIPFMIFTLILEYISKFIGAA